MTRHTSAQQARDRITRAFERMRGDIPQLSNIYDAFEQLLVEQAALKAELTVIETPDLEIDPGMYAQGAPLLGKDGFAVSWEQLREAAVRLLPAMAKGFPGIKGQLELLQGTIDKTDSASEPLARALTSGDHEALRQVAAEMSLEPATLEYAIGQLKKPYAEKKAESLPRLPEHVKWSKGYCPICGSWPELSFLDGTEGRRWLRCSFCAHEWQFPRTQCPCCETDMADAVEILFQEDRPFERAELCTQCKKYVVSVDLRDRTYQSPREAAALGLVHLDILAQEKGFSPAAISPWNVLE